MAARVLFINAINNSRGVEKRYDPLGIGYLVSSLRDHFGSDRFVFKVINEDVERQILEFKPDVVGISSVSQNFNYAVEYAKIAKKHNCAVLCGGIHISTLPQSLTKDMDIGVLGEGERTVCELFKHFFHNGSFSKNDLNGIKGIVYWDGDKIQETEKRPLIQTLDELPLPARDLFNIGRELYMFTSRGCPYECVFCASTKFWKGARLFSAKYVTDEIEYLFRNYQAKVINFYDDLFIINTERVREIIRLLEKKEILGKVKFLCTLRANLVTDEIAELLKKLGVTNVSMGFESGSDNILKYLKQDMKVITNKNAARIMKNHDFILAGSFIIGSPQETKEDILETLNFIKKNGIDWFEVYLLTPFPGTSVWDYAYSRGLVSHTMDWSKLDIDSTRNFRSALILSEKLTRLDLYKLVLRFKLYKLWLTLRMAIKRPDLAVNRLFNLFRGLAMEKKQSEDRRMFERVPLKISLRFLDCQTNTWSLVKTHDASVRGLGLVVKNNLASSTPLEMWLPLANQGESYYTKGKVVWSSKITPEKYRVGVCLDRLDLAGMSHFVKNNELMGY